MKQLLLVIFCFLQTILLAQTTDLSPSEIIQKFLNEKYQELELHKNDIQDWSVTSHHTSKQSGAMHIYIRQNYQGIPLFNGLANFALKDGKVFSMGNRLIDNIQQKIQYSTPSVKPHKAVEMAAQALGLPQPQNLKIIEAINSKYFIYNPAEISSENIPVQLMYFADENGNIKLVWDLSIYQLNAQHWWSVRIDAQTGDLLDKKDWVTHCKFEHSPFVKCSHKSHQKENFDITTIAAPDKLAAPDQYTVYALPLESPSHGGRTTVTNPADAIASPFGWHDTNGAAGAEYTITRGNNVHAYEDTLDNNSPGTSPNGGPTLEFNFPLNNAAQPHTYIPAATTNLFYMNNMLHDVWYRYGFDEASGNFQTNNYGNGGAGNDYVRAEAQDGSGTNNANFATPNDGSRPRMQMYVWPFNTTVGPFLDVLAPSNILGSYTAVKANFGPDLPPTAIVADVVLIEDAVAPTNDGCNTITNAAQLSGKIVLIDQGSCSFTDKIQAAQNAGALAVIIANTTGFLYPMVGTSATINIPSVMVLATVANAIKSELALGNTVTASIDNAGVSDKDSDLDNGIICHEYGHGISNRLCGGPSNSNCLHNSEQMGEGWSDWFALMMTIEPGDLGTDVRGIGTYVEGEPTTGAGIRPAPYSTDFAVNAYTYAHSNNAASISEPHGVGFIFATALWDLTWALIDHYGGTPSPDLYNGTGGNNIAMSLVIEGLKLQPCSPGMIDGRNAILQADQLLYNGAHQCIIWEVFRRRGFGYSASQGSENSRSDQTEAFNMAPVCLIATAPPIAAFSPGSINTCVSTIHFKDSSQSTPHQWFWDFGDGQSSTQQNPSHFYTSSGSYTVTLIVSNNMGNDTAVQQINITLPPTPVAIGDEVCAGNAATLTATGSGEIRWLNSSRNIIKEGDTLIIPSIASVQTYYAENITGTPSQQIGAVDSSLGNGSLHNAGYGALNFHADQSFEIVSALVYAGGSGSRTFKLATGTNNGTNPTAATTIDDVTVFLTNGMQRVYLNMLVPDTGDFNLGGNNVNLYRNTNGANYPYNAPGLMTINSSSSNSNSYFYFYDLEIRTPRCVSAVDTAFATPILAYFTHTNTNNTYTFTDGSSGATSWHWDFGDGNTSTLQNPVHTYATTGTYIITLTINGGTCISTRTINDVLGVQTTNNQLIPTVALMPNPSSDFVTVQLNRAIEEDLLIQIFGVDGRVLQTANLLQGSTQFTLNIENLPSAVYLVKIQGLTFSETRKLVKK